MTLIPKVLRYSVILVNYYKMSLLATLSDGFIIAPRMELLLSDALVLSHMHTIWRFTKRWLTSRDFVIFSQVKSQFVFTYNCDPFCLHGLTLIPAWTSRLHYHKPLNEITYPFPYFNGFTVEVWEWVSNAIPHFTGHLISYLCWNKSLSMLVKPSGVRSNYSDTLYIFVIRSQGRGIL